MDAAQFYRTVRRELGPGMKACGFRRTSTDIGLSVYPKAGMWIKLLPDAGPPPAPDRLILSFEHSKWGWLRSSGGSFRVNIEVGGCCSVLRLLDKDQRAQWNYLVRTVIHRIRRQPCVDRERLNLAESNFLHPVSMDFMPYWDEDDIIAYIELMRPWLPRFAADLGGDASLGAHFTPLTDPSPQAGGR